MKNIILFIILSFVLNLPAQDATKVSSRDHAVLLDVSVVDTLGQEALLLEWKENPLAEYYIINRKESGGKNFSLLHPVNQNEEFTGTDYLDQDVTPGKIYEYQVVARSYGQVKFQDPMDVVFDGYGYQAAGINVQKPPKGQVILIIDSTLKEPLSMEIERLREDMHKEGWGVITRYMLRTEEFNSDAVETVKDTIVDIEKREDNVTTVFLLGRIAVPYSGIQAWDAHGNHHGAWPSDLYYGHLNEFIWMSDTKQRTDAKWERNHNKAGDGKYDVSALPDNFDVELQVGRVDFYKMNAFFDEENQVDEITLYKRYLDKDHAFRTGQWDLNYRGIVDDNFNAFNMTEGFASSGWRNIASTVGKDNVEKKDFFKTLSSENYIWAYGCGGGSFTSAGGIGNTNDFTGQDVNAVFTMLFGSYFGDWDADNNFLRAPLASNPSALTCAWAGRPAWYFHHMTLGMPVGYSTKLSQNNKFGYYANAYYDVQNQNFTHIVGLRGTHTALMGDPTLILYPYDEPSVTSVSASPWAPDINEITWEPPPQEKLYSYNVYRAEKKYGLYAKINNEPIQGETSFVDENIETDSDRLYYTVRIVDMQYTNGGSYISESSAMRASVVTGVKDTESINASLQVSPNPAVDNVKITINSDVSANGIIKIYDLQGRVIKTFDKINLMPGSIEISWNLKDENYTKPEQGVYYIRLTADGKTFTEKLIIH